ncbi:MAG TPA: hypothetical protein VHS09_04895, partial [Polyangiaceae bacterium]|nr:hypothetical protein [Polyangiaceae bacterium]
LYGFWDTAQRDSFFDWFMLPSVALQLVAQRALTDPRAAVAGDPGGPTRGGGTRLLVLVGALSVIPSFGKPTYALFTVAQLLALFLDDELRVPRRRAVRAFVAGGALGALSQVALLVGSGDVLAYARIQLVDVPAMYRFIWPRAAADIFSGAWDASQAIYGIVGGVVLLALVLLREMPPRVIAVALLPACAVGSVVAQAKGFPYHFHPVTAGVHLQWLVFAAWLAERTRVARRRLALVRLLPVAFAVVVALRVATSMEDSPYIRAPWLLWGAATPAERETRAYFARFPEPDYFPFEMRETAAYLRRATAPGDRVQTYGMDPYVLFLARRLSATPYIYAYDLDADAALGGGTGGRPDDAQSAHIRALRDAHEADLLARLTAAPPAAFVFLDQAPLMTREDAWDDFEEHCPTAAAWVHERYRESARFGHDHVWLRADRVPVEPAPTDEGTPGEAP